MTGNLDDTRFEPIVAMMHHRHLFLLSGLLLTALPGSVQSAGLTEILSEDTAAILHVRSVPDLRVQWAHNPLAKTWAEPEVQAFFAPAIEDFQEENAGGLAELIRSETGLSPEELLDLIPGELAVAILDLRALLDEEEDQELPILMLADLGDDSTEMEALLERLVDEDETVTEEEFQGETLRLVESMGEEEDGPIPSVVWAIVENRLFLGAAKVAVQEAIANQKRGGADEPLASAPGFAEIYHDYPAAQGAMYLNLGVVVPLVTEFLEEENSAVAEDGQPSAMASMGITPESLVAALGLDQMTSAYAVAELSERTSIFCTGVKWNEEPNLMRVFAYGEPPAPKPSFIPDTWVSVSSGRFSITKGYHALKELLGDLNPGLVAMLDGQIAQMNQGLGIDIERDLIGNFGDEIIQGESLVGSRAESNPLTPTDQFFAASIHDQETAGRMIDAAMAMAPGMAQMITSREYLGETIFTFDPPVMEGMPPDAPRPSSFSYAITRNYLLVSVGAPTMVETAVQGLEGAGNSIWENPEIARALDALPTGESMVSYQDVRRLVVTIFDLIVKGAAMRADEDDGPSFDLDARPSAEVLARHWGPAVSAMYIDPDGVRSVARLEHGEAVED